MVIYQFYQHGNNDREKKRTTHPIDNGGIVKMILGE
jgi:hypothetical protein